MDNDIRSGNLKVEHLKEEIEQDLKKLKEGHLHKRAQRQILDATRFFSMIKISPYVTCRTVGELKRTISEQRDKLKVQAETVNKYVKGYQFSMFDENYGEVTQEVSENEKQIFETESERLKQEIRWLQKCLGMCSNRKYFK